MTNAKHTPGPWSLNIEDGRAEVCVDGERLTDPYIGDENARLIAAAPDLLASLKAIVPVVVNRILEPSSDQSLKDMILGAYDAIAKAEGR